MGYTRPRTRALRAGAGGHRTVERRGARMDDPLVRLPEQARRRMVAEAQPAWVEPMLATLTDRRFSDPLWIFEPKLDGERCLAFRDGGTVQLLSRNHKRLNERYPELVEAFASQEADDFVVDGEIVAFEGNRSSFARLQRRMQLDDPAAALRTGVPVYFYLFDVVHANGYDLTGLGLRDRKTVLNGLLRFDDPLRYTAHRDTEGEAYYRSACEKGWEGVIAK